MGRVAKIARRSFLIGSAAVVGGVAFGYYMYRRPHDNPLLDDLAEGEAALTPYVLIDADGVTLITPRTDLGQGAYSVQAALIAEELDVELDQVRVDPGPPDPAYYNTAMASEGAPFMSTDTSMMAEATRGAVDAVMKLTGMQMTGGSTTVADGYEKLRVAGAVARETLKQAAAQVSGIDAGRLTTEAGAVVLPDGSRLSYPELAPEAAKIEPVEEVALRDPADWRLLGKPMQRLDILAKSTGTQRYGIDLELEGMVHATVRMNPFIGGEMRGFEASEAEGMRGVQKIVPLPGGVAVVADNTWRAFRAAQAIEVDWAPGAYPAEQADHWEVLNASFTEDRVDSRYRDDGDVEAALSTGAAVEAEYRAPYLAHAPLEPVNAVALVDGEGIDIWSATQVPRFVQSRVATLTGLDESQVRVHVQMAGGSFGSRLETVVDEQVALIAREMPGTPVKLTWSREESMTHDIPRQIALGRARGTVAEGRVQSLDLGIAMPSIMGSQMGRQGYAMPGADTQIIAGAWDQPFAIPDYRMTGYRAEGLAPVSSWRSVGASTNAFFFNAALDELIHTAGADPLEERLRLCDHDLSRRVLEAVGEMSSWGGELAPGRGRGIAYCLSFGAPVAEVVEVAKTDAGIRVENVWVAAEVGRIMDPVNFEGLVKGGVIFGLGHAMNCEITYAGGAAGPDNYYAFEGMRLPQAPVIEVRGLENGDAVKGIGEPPVPPAAPALAGAIFAATGERLREMPFSKTVTFA